MESTNQRREDKRCATGDSVQDATYRAALVDFLLQLADDDLTLGHRDSEWLGIAPDIEEDVAFSSIAQDEVGHATLYFQLLSDLGLGTEDQLAFERPVSKRRSSWMVEHENGDWAYSIVRHYLYDVFENVRLEACAASSYEPLRFAVAKVRREEYYHLLHGETQFRYLATGGPESAHRVQTALQQVWSQLPNLFDLGEHAPTLVTGGVLDCDSATLRARFEARVLPELERLRLHAPEADPSSLVQRCEVHLPELDSLLKVMCAVVDIDKYATW